MTLLLHILALIGALFLLALLGTWVHHTTDGRRPEDCELNPLNGQAHNDEGRRR